MEHLPFMPYIIKSFILRLPIQTQFGQTLVLYICKRILPSSLVSHPQSQTDAILGLESIRDVAIPVLFFKWHQKNEDGELRCNEKISLLRMK